MSGVDSRCIDLHTHSTASDGARPPRDVVRAARELSLAAIALTDHDTVDGVADAIDEGRILGVRVVPGIELSAVEGDSETHVLGLHVQQMGRLETQLRNLRAMRVTRAERIVARLNELGVRVTLEDVLVQSAGGAVGRPHIARALVNDGWATDMRDAFDRYLGNGRAAFVPKDRLSIEDAIAMIHGAGGLAILAHPGQSGTRKRIEALVGFGLDGVEVRHPGHNSEDIARLTALVEHFGLIPSGGSDWHGSAEGGRTLGMMRVPAAWLERQDQAVATRNAQSDGDHEAYVA
ncbi:MAG TPA: PHP domain-containing protein [Gemmatimonadaceae bacterium]|nr:PHP domain-containing protein [Gemmatimonadaceae bacterium]